MVTFACTSAEGEETTFELVLPEQRDAGQVEFRVYENEQRQSDTFVLRLVAFGSAMRVELMGQVPRPEWAKRKGIPDALLPLAARYVERDPVFELD